MLFCRWRHLVAYALNTVTIVSHTPPLVDDSLRGCGHRFEFSVRQGIFLPESTSSADFHGVRAAQGCNRMHSASVCMLKIPNTSSHTTVWIHSNTVHTDSSDCSWTQCIFEYPSKWCTYNAVWLLHGWCWVKLLPSQHMFCVHHKPVYITLFEATCI